MNRTFNLNIDNKEYTYNILKILEPSNMPYKYIIYSDNEDIYASRFNVEDSKLILSNIEKEYEYTYIDEVISYEL